MSGLLNNDEWPVEEDDTVAYYIRRSTVEQENQHQLDGIKRWFEKRDVNIGRAREYEDTASGASRMRDDLQLLISDIEDGEIDHVVVWELSRIARDGLLAQEFFNLCEDESVVIHVTDGNIRTVTPDGDNRLVADIYASIYADERRTLIRRTKMGQQRALENGQWVGKPPVGFTTDDEGYLIANVDFFENYTASEAGFYEVEEALRRIDEEDASYRGLSKNARFSRPTISNLDQDPDKRAWFTERVADDERIQAALDELSRLESEGKIEPMH